MSVIQYRFSAHESNAFVLLSQMSLKLTNLKFLNFTLKNIKPPYYDNIEDLTFLIHIKKEQINVMF